jgi:hypothetical protein
MGAGAWELRGRKQVLAAAIHTETTTIAWAMGLRKLQSPGDFVAVTGMPYDHARNACVQQMLQGGYEWLFFLDSDVICPPETIHRLMHWGQPVVSGTYFRRSPPHGVAVAIKNGQWVSQMPPENTPLMEVDFVGAGCLLAHRSVFERHYPESPPGKPWFHWKVDQAGHVPAGEALSEDFEWNRKIRNMGYKILLDTGIKCLHVGLAQAGHGSLAPLSHYA